MKRRMHSEQTYIWKGTVQLKMLFSVLMLFLAFPIWAQEDEERAARQAERYMEEAEEAVADKDFESAEAYYRQAIAKDPSNATARYNMGNLYHNNEKPVDAVERHSQAAELAEDKPMKHKAFHNMGNALMDQKKYQEAVEAYKNALRNNPNDNETRYNLALAKQKWEEEQESGGGDQDQDQDGENQDQESDNQEQGDEGEQEQDDQGDQQDQQEGGDEENQDQQEGEGQDKEEDEPQGEQEPQEGDQSEEEGQPQQQQPIPGQLSPEQIKNLLEAMGNEEKKVQDKINAEKARGAKTTSEKDW